MYLYLKQLHKTHKYTIYHEHKKGRTVGCQQRGPKQKSAFANGQHIRPFLITQDNFYEFVGDFLAFELTRMSNVSNGRNCEIWSKL